MKPAIVNIVILLSVITAAYLVNFHQSPSQFENIISATEGAKNILKRQGHISLIMPVKNDFVSMYVNYAMAPILLDEKNNSDTTLIIIPKDYPDSQTTQLVTRGLIIWQNKDQDLKYLIVAKR